MIYTDIFQHNHDPYDDNTMVLINMVRAFEIMINGLLYDLVCYHGVLIRCMYHVLVSWPWWVDEKRTIWLCFDDVCLFASNSFM